MPLSRRMRTTSPLIGSLVITLLAALFVLVPTPASAAGDGVLNVAITPIDTSDSSTITEIADGQHGNRITYEVQYSCGTAACDDAEVQLSPSQADPNGLLPPGRFLLLYDSWTGPVGGGTIDGDDTTGKSISLGDLAAGASGSFKVTYRIERPFSSPGNDSGNDVPNGSFYPDGFQIEMAATISSESAVAPVTEGASDVTWHIEVPNGPTANVGIPASMRPGEDITFPITMNAGNMFAGSGANITARASLNAAGSYTVVYTAPAEATIVGVTRLGIADPTAVIDNVANTITWTMGSSANPVYGARGGWGLNQAGSFNGAATGPRNSADPDTQAFWRARYVTLNFDGDEFDEADANGCNFAAEVEGTLDVSVTYLDAASTTKTVQQTKSADVACWDPFGGMFAAKYLPASQTTRLDGAITNSPYWVSALNVPGPGAPDRTNAYWQVAVSNRGNVPAVATIDEANLVHDHIKVDRIRPTSVGATIEWTADDGSGTISSGTDHRAAGAYLNAPAGGWFTAVTATTDPIEPSRIQPSDTGESWAYLNMHFRVDNGASAELGERRLNTAEVELTYPDFGGAGEPAIYEPWTDIADQVELDQPLTETVQHAAQYTQITPVLRAGFDGAPVVDGGGNPAPGTEVTYSVYGQTDGVWQGTQITPQLAFVAPVGWEIIPGSAEMDASAPPGVTFEYLTKTIGGASRQLVLATWPAAINPDHLGAENWPALTARATPGATAPTGTGAAVAHAWAGDASGHWSDAVGTAYATGPGQFRATTPTADSADIDGDFNIGEEFATGASGSLTVAASTLLTAVKEICVPNGAAADGCDWASDPADEHFVPVNAGDVKYRITVRNTGNTDVSGAIAYDVLPHVGDTGLLPGAAERGSQFDMTIASIESVTAGATLAYSSSTNPARPEVNPGASGTVDDWGTDEAGKKAIRIEVDDTLAPGDTESVVLVAAVAPGAEADQVACNSVAIDSPQTLPAEPQAVCVTLAEADLQIVLGDVSDLYPGTTRTLDYTVTNLGGSASAPGSTSIDIPAGITVTDLDVDGWSCEVVGGGAAPVAGAATLECDPVDGSGDPRELELNVSDPLSLPIDVASTITGTEVCFPASVMGALYDPVMLNNLTNGCRALAEPDVPVLRVEKTFELTTDNITPDEADEGDVITYTFTVYNDGPGMAHNVSVNDALPGLSAVSPASVSIAEGSSAVYAATYTVTADDVVAGSVENFATATFTPPTPPGGTTPPTVTTPPSNLVEVPVVLATPQLEVTKSVDPASGTVVGAGDVLTYTLTFENTGYVPAPVDHLDDLDGVLDDADIDLVSPGTLSVTPNGTAYEIAGTVPAGATATVVYTATVKERAQRGDDTLVNFLLGPGQDPPTSGACDPAGAIACTANPVEGEIDVVKSVDADGPVSDGDIVTYTLEITNPGRHAGPVDLVDHLAGVLDDAAFGEIISAGGLDVVVDGDLMRVTGQLDGGDSTEVVYTVKARGSAVDGDGVLLNVIAANGVVVDSDTCDQGDPHCTSTKVKPKPSAALPDTGAPVSVEGLLLALLLLLAGTTVLMASRQRRTGPRHAR